MKNLNLFFAKTIVVLLISITSAFAQGRLKSKVITGSKYLKLHDRDSLCVSQYLNNNGKGKRVYSYPNGKTEARGKIKEMNTDIPRTLEYGIWRFYNSKGRLRKIRWRRVATLDWALFPQRKKQ
jgi:hypothetical protein